MHDERIIKCNWVSGLDVRDAVIWHGSDLIEYLKKLQTTKDMIDYPYCGLRWSNISLMARYGTVGRSTT